MDPTATYAEQAVGTATYFPAFRWDAYDIAELYDTSGSGELTLPIHDVLPDRRRLTAWRDAVVRAHRHQSALCVASGDELPHDPGEERQLLRTLLGPHWTIGA